MSRNNQSSRFQSSDPPGENENTSRRSSRSDTHVAVAKPAVRSALPVNVQCKDQCQSFNHEPIIVGAQVLRQPVGDDYRPRNRPVERIYTANTGHETAPLPPRYPHREEKRTTQHPLDRCPRMEDTPNTGYATPSVSPHGQQYGQYGEPPVARDGDDYIPRHHPTGSDEYQERVHNQKEPTRKDTSNEQNKRPVWVWPVTILVAIIIVAAVVAVGVVVGTSNGGSHSDDSMPIPVDNPTGSPNTAPTMRQTSAPTMSPISLSTARIVSDGRQNRPRCSWDIQCIGDDTQDSECAQKLCEAAGFVTGTFVSRSNNYCSSSFSNDGSFWHWFLDDNVYVFSDRENEASITADCSLPGSGDIVISDGTRARPHCSWDEVCAGDTTEDEECAQMLCEASGYSSGEFLSRSNEYCTSSLLDDSLEAWYWSVDQDDYIFSSTASEASIIAMCIQ